MEVTKWLKPSDKRVTFAQPRNVRFNLPTSSVVPCHVGYATRYSGSVYPTYR